MEGTPGKYNTGWPYNLLPAKIYWQRQQLIKKQNIAYEKKWFSFINFSAAVKRHNINIMDVKVIGSIKNAKLRGGVW